MRIIAPMMILIMMTSTLAGCTGTEDDGSEVEIIITDATSIDFENILCGQEATNHSICHRYVVLVSNDGDEDLSISSPWAWFAIGDDGGLYQSDAVDGPEAVIPGGETSVTVMFEMSGDIRLTSLRFEELWSDNNDLIETTIPSNYEHLIYWDVIITLEDSFYTDEGDDYCGYEDSEECHTFVVSVMNNGLEGFDTYQWNWEALGDDGVLYSARAVDGIDTIETNITSSISIHFDVTNGVKITTLYYDWMFWIPVEQINISLY